MIKEAYCSDEVAKLLKEKGYIDSIPEEPVSEELEEASRNYADNEEYGDDVYYAIKAAFKIGAQWQKEQMIKKTSEWLTKNFHNDKYWGQDNEGLFIVDTWLIEDLIKELKENKK